MGEEQTQSQHDLHGEVESLKADLHKLQSDLREITDTIWGMGQQSYQHASDSMHESVEHGLHQVEDYVSRQPIKTLIMAFVGGLVLGKLFSRR
jgi:ElaB/YqjD/DUF883 family membrane-anchored ribosome-binding protein